MNMHGVCSGYVHDLKLVASIGSTYVWLCCVCFCTIWRRVLL